MTAEVKLPTRLEAQPIIDAVLELRFAAGSQPASAILPGALMLAYKDYSPRVERLPASMVPDPMRQMDAQFTYQAVIRVVTDKFSIGIGDRSIAISMASPYPGWAEFKRTVLALIENLGKLNVFSSLERYSIKYVDFVPGADVGQLRKFINFDVSLGGRTLSTDPIQLRTEHQEQDYVTLTTLLIPANVQKPGSAPEIGLVLDIDIISKKPGLNLRDLTANSGSLLDEVHGVSKRLFFDMLTDTALEKLGAKYD